MTSTRKSVSSISLLNYSSVYVCVCVCVHMHVHLSGHAFVLSHVRLFVTPWTVAHQAPLSMEFPRQEYWSGLPFFTPGDLLDPEIEPTSPVSCALQVDSLPTEPGKPSLLSGTHNLTLEKGPGPSLRGLPSIKERIAVILMAKVEEWIQGLWKPAALNK